MKNLFFVSVALGILSGTSISVKAQTAISLERLNIGKTIAKYPQFIDGIEIKRQADITSAIPDRSLKTTPVIAIPSVKKPALADFGTSIEECTSLQFKYAQLMDMEVEVIKNNTLYTAIEEWWATRYRYGGTTKKGIDCSAYVGELLRAAYKINPPRTARAQYAVCEKLTRDELREGDLVFFNTRGGISHVGMYLGNNYFTHSSTSNGVTISNLNDNYYSKKFICGGRMTAEYIEATAEVE